MKKYLGFFAALIIITVLMILSGMILFVKYDICRQAGHGTISCIVTSVR